MRIEDALARLTRWVAHNQYDQRRIKALSLIETLSIAAATGVETIPTPQARALAPIIEPGVAHATLGDQVTTDPQTARTWAAALYLTRRREPVLILGESGTGKESIAKALHGARDPARFVAVNCGAIPEGLVESILFGHKRGAFTGASSDHDGAFVRANGGTIFLDEVGDLPLPAQTKLLRAIQESTVVPVGGTKPQPFEARVVAATHKLDATSPSAGFRLDLYHRLAVHVLQTRPLRDRPGDIPLIARKLTALDFTAAALARLSYFPYHGNVRELANVVTRCETHAQMRGASVIEVCDVFYLAGGAEDFIGENEASAEDLLDAVY